MSLRKIYAVILAIYNSSLTVTTDENWLSFVYHFPGHTAVHNEIGTNVVRDLNSKIAADERVDRVLVPIGDGMTLARRRG